MPCKSPRIHATALMRQFRCSGPACEDSCCGGWEIEVDAATMRKYKRKPSLVDAFEPDITKGGTGQVMCRNAESGNCLQHVEGWCTVQARYGEDYLSETCYFFPRVFRLLGTEQMGSAMLSCPETARMALFGTDMFIRGSISLPRTIPDLAQRLPAGLAFDAAYRIHERILLSLDDDTLPVEAHLARLVALAYGLDDVAKPDWEDMLDFYLRQSPPLVAPAGDADIFALAHSMLKLAIADRSQYRPRLYRTIRDMEVALELAFHWKNGTMETGSGSEEAWSAARASWQPLAIAEDGMLKNWLRAQLARIAFPFGGLGHRASEQVYTIVVAFSTTRLALLCANHLNGGKPEDVEKIRIVQSLARIFEHIEDISVFDAHYPQIDRQRQEPLLSLLRLP